MNRKTLVISLIGINDVEIQEEFTLFFQSLVEKYGENFGCSLSKIREKSHEEDVILIMSKLDGDFERVEEEI